MSHHLVLMLWGLYIPFYMVMGFVASPMLIFRYHVNMFSTIFPSFFVYPFAPILLFGVSIRLFMIHKIKFFQVQIVITFFKCYYITLV
jgi:hypothetical protein